MRYLLDTQVWLWLQVSPERLRPEVLVDFGAPGTRLYLSVASAWEIAIKFGLGKLPLPEPPGSYVPSRCAAQGIEVLTIELAEAVAVSELPMHHRDPFDRLLVCQARRLGLTLVTVDSALEAYDVRRLDPTGGSSPKASA
ncbi:MAG: type II toxin-antitoxin system VapC family toxin [Thermoanaerobaculia bacterium]|nr:type II toxin-antitoxin system VapC family toxin [Thermoanaerobaculia bacterium]